MTRLLCEPINICIYCGRDASSLDGLTDEHLFPEGAGGDLILPKASCRDCSKETSAFERSCLRDFYGVTRAHLKLYGRRRKDERPQSLPIVTTDGEVIADVDVRQFPFVAIRLEMPPPGILVGRERNPQQTMVTDYGLRFVTLPDAVERNRSMGKTFPGGVLKQTVPISDYYRLLAKVGHGLAVAVFGINGFDAALADYVRRPGGEATEGSYFIGGAFEFGQRVEEFGAVPHAHRATVLRPYVEQGWIVVRTQLFGPIGAVYDVFAGSLR